MVASKHGAEQTRVALAIALMSDADFRVLDLFPDVRDADGDVTIETAGADERITDVIARINRPCVLATLLGDDLALFHVSPARRSRSGRKVTPSTTVRQWALAVNRRSSYRAGSGPAVDVERVPAAA